MKQIEQFDFPALLGAAENESASQQRTFYTALGTQFVALGIAAFAALLPTDAVGGVGPILTLVLLVGVIVLQASRVAPRAERRWYDARAASESIKSASWQYAVGGESFRLDDPTTAERFCGLLREVLKTLPTLRIGSADVSNAAATPSMQTLRASSIGTRETAYRRLRIEDQAHWYSSKAKTNRQRSRRFNVAALTFEGAAFVLGVLRVKGVIEVDLLSALVAVAAGLVGWSQAKKFDSLAEAYAVTSIEVGLVAASLVTTGTEAQWAQSVHDAEAAFSREHTMWQARRQGPS